MKYLPEYMLADISADKTAVMASGDTYIGDFDRSKVADGTPLEDQPIWKIKKISLIESDGVSLYEAKYPEGNANLYGYKWSDILSLSYQFSKHK